MSQSHEVTHSFSFDAWLLTFIVLWWVGGWVHDYLDRAYPKPPDPTEQSK